MTTPAPAHIYTWNVGEWHQKGATDLLAEAGVRNIVSCDQGHTERRIWEMSADLPHNRMEFKNGRGQVAVEVLDGICLEGSDLYGIPVKAGEDYRFRISVTCGTIVDGEWRQHNYATGAIQITTAGETVFGDADRGFMHAHPHGHPGYMRTFNTIFARLDRLTPTLPAGSHTPAPSDDDDDDTDDTSGSST